MAHADYRKELKDFGPGGYKCYCCGPRDAEDKKRARRKYRRKIRSEKYDAYYCLNCGAWLEEPCPDTNCEFCKDRPDKAFQAEDMMGEI